MNIKRITIDLDNKNILVKWYSFFILSYYGFRKIKIVDSPSKRGFHLVGWHKIGYPINVLLAIRVKAGDDKARIYFDKQKNRHLNILFTEKTVKIFKTKKDLVRCINKWQKQKKL